MTTSATGCSRAAPRAAFTLVEPIDALRLPQALSTVEGLRVPLARQTAFTLVEIAIVVFILAVIMAVSIPSFVRSYNASLLNQSARSLVTLTELARLQAGLHQRPARLHVDLDRQVTWVAQRAAAGEGNDDEAVVKVVRFPNRVALVSAQVPDEQPVRQGQVAVEFQPNGTAQAVTFVLRGADPKDLLGVLIDPVTGHAVVEAVR